MIWQEVTVETDDALDFEKIRMLFLKISNVVATKGKYPIHSDYTKIYERRGYNSLEPYPTALKQSIRNDVLTIADEVLNGA